MSDVKRFRPYYFDPINLTGHEATMRQNTEGDYVLASDYDALAAETTAYVDKLVAEKRVLEAALDALSGARTAKAKVKPRGKPCTCDNCLGSSISCHVEAGGQLGDLWYCVKQSGARTAVEGEKHE